MMIESPPPESTSAATEVVAQAQAQAQAQSHFASGRIDLEDIQSLDDLYITQAINNLSKICHDDARENGWWDEPDRNKGELIALMHSELSEALEAIRTNSMDDKLPQYTGESTELADVIIRIMDYCGAFRINIGDIIMDKIKYNRIRQDHKKEYRQNNEHGKKF